MAISTQTCNNKLKIDFQHGMAFNYLRSTKTSDSLDVAISLFVDWFNPQGNKISGTIESTGLFMFSCLNLPPDLYNKISPLCLAGITAGPSSPDPQTVKVNFIKALMDVKNSGEGHLSLSNEIYFVENYQKSQQPIQG